MQGIGSVDNVNSDLTYEASFGSMPNGTTYMYVPSIREEDAKATAVLPFGGNSKSDEIKAALTTGSPLMAISTTYSSTSGSIPVLLPTVVDSQLYDLTKRDTPLASGLIPRVTNRGIFADYIKRTALPSAYFKPEMAALASSTSTYTRAAKKMSYIYATGEISGPMQVASQVWQNALQLELEAQYRAVKELEETTIILGNPTSGTTDGTYADENAFDGLQQSITTNTLDKGSTVITLPDIRKAIRTCKEAKGHPNLIVTDYKTLDDIKSLISDSLRYGPQTYSIAFGITAVEFEGLPIIPDLFMPTTTNSRELFVLDTTSGNIQMRVLQDATMEELAKTADSYKFTIKEYITMIVVQEAWCYRIYGLV